MCPCVQGTCKIRHFRGGIAFPVCIYVYIIARGRVAMSMHFQKCRYCLMKQSYGAFRMILVPAAELLSARSLHTLCSASCNMVIYDSLNVLVCLYFSPSRVVARHSLWVYINNLSISFVLEKQAFLVLSNHLQQKMFRCKFSPLTRCQANSARCQEPCSQNDIRVQQKMILSVWHVIMF